MTLDTNKQDVADSPTRPKTGRYLPAELISSMVDLQRGWSIRWLSDSSIFFAASILSGFALKRMFCDLQVRKAH